MAWKKSEIVLFFQQGHIVFKDGSDKVSSKRGS